MFNMMLKKDVTPNEFYVLHCIKENTSSLSVNLHKELRSLVNKKLITEVHPDKGLFTLTPGAHTLLQQVESFFMVHKKKTTNQVLGKDYQENIEKYLLLFPKIKLPSGKAARTDKNNCETAFKWFFQNHNYSWDTVLKATGLYIDEYERKNYMYMQTSQYFIRKQQPDKSWGSELANWCSIVENGGLSDDKSHFSEEVV